jgi:ABC-type branched-subunit amino acid transport system ATPase component
MLTTERLGMSFGGVKALDDVSLHVPAGSVLGLVGPNGSGKSTFLTAVGGFVAATGKVTVDGAPLRLRDPRVARRAGVLRTFQTPQLYDQLTCLENVLLADSDRRAAGLFAACLARPLTLRRERSRWERAQIALERVSLGARAGAPAGSVTFSERRRLELARALTAEPKVLLLDEPTAGLNDAETDQFGELLGGLTSKALAMVLVDHKIDFIDRLCDEVVVLELGRVIAQGPPKQVWADERVIDAYLGADHAVA